MPDELLEKDEAMLRVRAASRVFVVGPGVNAEPVGVSKGNLLFAIVMANRLVGFMVYTASDGAVTVGNFS